MSGKVTQSETFNGIHDAPPPLPPEALQIMTTKADKKKQIKNIKIKPKKFLKIFFIFKMKVYENK